MARKPVTCRTYRCNRPPVLGGLCEQHHAEQQAKEQARREAVDAIMYHTVDGARISSAALLDELKRLVPWWDKAHWAMQYGLHDPVLRDEVEYAPEWCIAIAAVIVAQERDHRLGKGVSEYDQELKRIAWERFDNLSAGLMSNGVPRRER